MLTAPLYGDETAELCGDDSARLGGDGGDGEHEASAVVVHDARAVYRELSYGSGGG